MQCFPFPSSFPVIFHSTLFLPLIRTLFSLSPSLSYWYSPNLTLPAHYKNTHALQTKTLVVSATQAPIKVNGKDSCFIY